MLRPASRSRVAFLTACALAAVVPWLPASSTASAQLVPGSCGSCSDFDGDGYADLAIGTPRDNVGGVKDAGVVNVLYGSDSGLRTAGYQLWHQDVAGVPEAGENGDLSGFSLAAGDFDGDGYADLTVGAPFEDVGTISNAGAVLVLYGSDTGLATDGAEVIDQSTTGVPDDPEAGDQFGYALAAGDLDDDGDADLTVSVHREDVRGVSNSGAVQVIPGSADGLATEATTEWSQATPGFGDSPGPGDSLGTALASGDLDGDGYDDVAVGAPGENLDAKDEGMVHVLYGSSAGAVTRGKPWTQDRSGIVDRSEPGDRFGAPLDAGDLDGDGIDDLAVAAAAEDIGPVGNAGAVNVIFGTSGGLASDGNQFWHQDSDDVFGTAGSGDALGTGLAVGDLTGDGIDDLAMGARYDDEDGVEDAGAMNVLFGSSNGPTSIATQFWTQQSPGLPDPAELTDHFGSVLAIGRFGPGPASDLAIGVHFETVGELTFAGALHVLPGSTSGPAAPGMFLTQDLDGVGEGTEAYDFFPFALAAG